MSKSINTFFCFLFLFIFFRSFGSEPTFHYLRLVRNFTDYQVKLKFTETNIFYRIDPYGTVKNKKTSKEKIISVTKKNIDKEKDFWMMWMPLFSIPIFANIKEPHVIPWCGKGVLEIYVNNKKIDTEYCQDSKSKKLVEKYGKGEKKSKKIPIKSEVVMPFLPGNPVWLALWQLTIRQNKDGSFSAKMDGQDYSCKINCCLCVGEEMCSNVCQYPKSTICTGCYKR